MATCIVTLGFTLSQTRLKQIKGKAGRQMPELKELLVDNLQDLLNAEHQIVGALPKMAEAAQSAQLKRSIEKHLEQTQRHVERLQAALQVLGAKEQQAEPCKGMKGLLEEGQQTIAKGGEREDYAADLALIAAAQKVEHYEICGYGNARSLARQIGEHKVVKLLAHTLGEEERSDFLLTEISKPLLQEAMSVEFGNGTKAPWGEPGDVNNQQQGAAARPQTPQRAKASVQNPKRLEPEGGHMYHHIKELMYTVEVGTPDPDFGNMLLEQFGGANGELAAAMQYSVQGINCDDPERKDLLMDIGTEELSHLEVVGALARLHLRPLKHNRKPAEIDPLIAIAGGGGVALHNSMGNPWTADYLKVTGELDVDLRSNIAAEARAKIVYERLIQFTEDAGTIRALQFLMTREITHMKAFTAALESLGKNRFSIGSIRPRRNW